MGLLILSYVQYRKVKKCFYYVVVDIKPNFLKKKYIFFENCLKVIKQIRIYANNFRLFFIHKIIYF